MGSIRRHRKIESDNDSIVFGMEPGENHSFAGLPYDGEDGTYLNNGRGNIDNKNVYHEPESFWINNERYEFEGTYKI